MALNVLFFADVPLRNYSLTHSYSALTSWHCVVPLTVFLSAIAWTEMPFGRYILWSQLNVVLYKVLRGKQREIRRLGLTSHNYSFANRSTKCTDVHCTLLDFQFQSCASSIVVFV